ncbi:MAG: DUF2800 domain-containing protein [Clostridiales bacterium]|nr:DUF2800 domain-containing protein [Clostridiales bacterium]
MNWNKHSNLEGRHAFLSPSSYHWINYDDEKMADRYNSFLAVQRGTEYHAGAEWLIKHGEKVEDLPKTFNMFVNDAIGYKMQAEQKLYYSDNCFGTADAICFRNNFLRIHDLKTGEVPAHMEQLLIYAALFCLEYRVKPGEIGIELRIYQNNEIVYDNPTAEDIGPIMDRIVTFDKIIESIKEEA